MTYFTQTQETSSVIERILVSASSLLAEVAERHAKRRAYNVTYNELSAMSNRDLADIGISRSEIRRVSMEAAGY